MTTVTGVKEKISCCAFCGSKNLFPILDFGNVGLAGSFLEKKELAHEKKYRLRLVFCRDCFAVQVIDKIPPTIFFQNYFYFSSAISTLKSHFEDYANEVVERFIPSEDAVVLEIGCNDGVLLKPIADMQVSTIIGVDPAKNVISTINDDRIIVVNDYFSESLAVELRDKHGAANIIMANNVFAHINDISAVTRAIKSMLSFNGVFVFEVHYLGNIIDNNQYDMVYHEHIYYYSISSLLKHFSRHSMCLFDVKLVPTHGGSIRGFVCKDTSKYTKFKSTMLSSLIEKERKENYNKDVFFRGFAARIHKLRDELLFCLKKFKKKGNVIVGYGASGRANTILQFCNIDGQLIDYMIDDAPAKHGFYTPGTHLEIKSSDVLTGRNKPDIVVIFAWFFRSEIMNRHKNFTTNGGTFIVPLPSIEIIHG